MQTENTDTAPFGTWVRQQRQVLDLTQEALAQAVGCAPITIKKIEAGSRRASPQLAARLTARLQTTAETDIPQAIRAQSWWAVGATHAGLLEPARRPVLPTPVDRLVGRRTELAQIVTLLTTHQTRIVTLIGPGGVGKTRLALGAAHACVPAFDEVWCLKLAAIPNGQLILPTLAQSLGLAGGTDPMIHSQLLAYLRSRATLLVLDNLEHLVTTLPDLRSLLQAAPKLHILATSQARLHVDSEVVVRVKPLPVPPTTGDLSAEALSRYDAVQLLVARI